MKQWTYYRTHRSDSPAESQFWYPGGTSRQAGRYTYENYIRTPILIVYANSINEADAQFHAITNLDVPVNLMGAMYITVEMQEIDHVDMQLPKVNMDDHLTPPVADVTIHYKMDTKTYVARTVYAHKKGLELTYDCDAPTYIGVLEQLLLKAKGA